MSRIRTIKPEIHTDSKTGTLSDRGFRIFVGMLNFADDYGVIEGDDAQLKAQIIPHINEGIDEATRCIRLELLARGIILMFFVDTSPYYWICNFEQHQRVDHPGKPKIAKWFEWKIKEKLQQTLADKSDRLVLQFDTNNDNSENARESSRVLAPEGNGREGKGKEEDVEAQTGKIRFSPESGFQIPQEQLKNWEKAYGGVPVEAEIQKAAAWVQANPKRSKKNWDRFLTNWFSNYRGPKASESPFGSKSMFD